MTPEAGQSLDSVRARRNPFPGQETRMASDGPTEWANCNSFLTCASCKCTTCNYSHASARAALKRNVRGKRGKREHAIAGCAYPFLRLMSTFAFRPPAKKEREREKVYDRFDDPCQVDRESVTGASQQGRRTPTTTTTRKPPFSLPILPFRFDGPWTPLITVNFEQIHWIDWLPVILDFLTR